MSGNIYWLASYPKSGNTWLRILLTNYLRNSDEPADINCLDTGPIASGRQIFDDNVGVEASDLTQDEIERYRPYVYQKISETAKSQIFIKVHDAYSFTPEGIPLLAPAASGGFVYLVRNPLEVCVSFAHHSASTIEKTYKNMNNSDYAFVERSDRLHNQFRQRLFSWSDHVNSFLDQPGLRLLLLRYEDMLADTERALTQVVEFAGLDYDPERIRRAVQFSSFEKLQAQEVDKGFSEKSPRAKSFFRKGRSDSWRSTLDTATVEGIWQQHGDTMTRLGYSAGL
ncbi:MAG: sulfotransferase domain-containing protein [Granulosicoccus sp.]|nr:sulfotransferase domain-containing protein [Granulosicoccus sp.]